MLQEEQTVSFDPRYIDNYVPWYIGMFHLYLALVLLLALFRSARLVWNLRSRRTAARASESAMRLHAEDFWEYAYVRTRSLKTLSHLTFLVSVVALLWSAADDLTQVATQKTASIRAVAGAFADILRTFSMGIVVSIALLCAAVLCERLVRKRKLGAAREQSKEVQP